MLPPLVLRIFPLNIFSFSSKILSGDNAYINILIIQGPGDMTDEDIVWILSDEERVPPLHGSM